MPGFRRISTQACVATFFALVALMAFRADAFELLRDINRRNPGRATYAGETGVALPGGLLVSLQDHTRGSELWFVDGTPGGTRVVRDIRPGADGSSPSIFHRVGNIAVFLAFDGKSGGELWRSDGTAAGTYMLADIGPGAAGYLGSPSKVVLNDVLLFTANDGVSGHELWRTDGTRAGTYLLADIVPGYEGSSIDELWRSSSHVFFERPGELWVTDGTAAGTRSIVDFGSVGSVFAVGDSVYFPANDPVHGIELWRADADGDNLQMVANLNTEPVGGGQDGDAFPSAVGALGDSLIFVAQIPNGGGSGTANDCKLFRTTAGGTGVVELANFVDSCGVSNFIAAPGGALFRKHSGFSFDDTELWITDGTPEGTGPLDLNGLDYSSPASESFDAVHDDNGIAYFFARFPGDGEPDKIWRTDGTRAGTQVFADLDMRSMNRQLAYLDGRLFFDAGVGTRAEGDELWTTDGTDAGTTLVRDVGPAANDSNLTRLRVIDGKLHFFAGPNTSLLEPWVSDGTFAGTLNLGNAVESQADTNASSNPSFAGEIGGRVIFAADAGLLDGGKELYATDGTPTGTVVVRDINEGGSSDPDSFVVFGNLILFVARDFSSGRELWRTDGTEAGTFRLADIGPQDGNVMLAGPVSIHDGITYFSAGESSANPALWRTDGTEAGTYGIPGTAGRKVFVLGSSGTHLLYRGLETTPPYAARLWAWDGTQSQIIAAANGVNIVSVAGVPFDGRLCFLGWDVSPEHYDVWCASGLPGDLLRATDLAAPELTAHGLRVLGNKLLVNAGSAGQPDRLYVTQGLPAGLELLSSRAIAHAEPFGTVGLVYASEDGHLMLTDGTPGGTRDLLEGADLDGGEIAGPFGVLGEYVVFVVEDPEAGPVLWRTDGTPAGTRYLADIDPGTAPASPEAGQFHAFGSTLLFSAHHADMGRELWAINATDPNASDDAGATIGGTPVTVAVLDNDADFDGSLAPGSVTIVNQPFSGIASVDSTTGAITYTANQGFSGTDRVTYRVSDDAGRASNRATLTISVAAGPGGNPPPTPPPTNNPPPANNSGGGGGGGALGFELLWLILLLTLRPARRYFLPNSASSAARAASASPVGAT